MNLKSARSLTLLAACGLLLAGCGRTAPQLAYPAAVPASHSVAARSVTPDKEFAGDLRRAMYWQADAVLVMCIHTTALNTTGISASANVFFSPRAFHRDQPAVFVARHYGISSVAQYRETVEATDVAQGLKPIGAYQIKAEKAWSLAKNFKPANANPAEKQPGRFFIGSRAFLIQQDEPQWNFYASSEKFLINANTGAITAPTPQVNAKDPLPYFDPAKDADVALQRASSVWLPMSLGQPTNHEGN